MNKISINTLGDKVDLIRELEEIQRQIDLVQKQSPSNEKGGLTVFRNCPQLSAKDWEKIVKQFNLVKWIALPSDKIIGPALDVLLNQLEELQRISEQDPLTRLLNRGGLERVLALETERSIRYKSPLSLALLDLDDFKAINDRYGHESGDQTLKAVAKILKKGIRKIDYAARYGGEEFVLILPGTGLRAAQYLVQRIMNQIRDLSIPVPGTQAQIRPTASIGLACFKGKKAVTPKDLLNKADQAMYQAKQNGKDQLVLADIIDLEVWDKTLQVSKKEKQFLFGGNN